MFSLALALLTAVGMSGCAARDSAGPSEGGVRPGDSTAQKRPADEQADVLATINRGADPCDDFYEYACGGWIGRTPLPAHHGYWTRGVGALSGEISARMRDVFEDSSTAEGEDEARLRRFYGACMDGGGSALANLRRQLGGIADSKRRRDFIRSVASVHGMGATPFVQLSVAPDGESPETMALHIRQGGLGLPALKFYSSNAEEHQRVLDAYRSHMASMFKLLGMPDQQAADAAKAVVHFESALAGYQTDRSVLRDPRETHNKLTVQDLRRLSYTPWHIFLEELGHPEITGVVVESRRYMAGIGMLLARTPPATARQYVRWHLILQTAAHVPELAETHNEFFGKQRGGRREPAPAWQRCVTATQTAMPVAFGRAYVKRFFAPEQRAAALEILNGVEDALKASLEQSGWADPASRTQAQAKLAAVHKEIGHQGTWPSPVNVSIDPANHLENVFAAHRRLTDTRLGLVGKPVVREYWEQSPSIVDASYSRRRNRLTVTAAFLQPPFFDHGRPAVMNFAALGQAVGHELTHGLDEQGRYFDGGGRLGDLWTDATVRAFGERATCIETLYSAEEVEPGHSIDGARTLDEGIADLGGLQLAHAAYRRWARSHGGDESPHVQGLSNEQLFFVAYAQAHCTVTTEEYLRLWVANDSRPPPPASVNLPVAAIPAFVQAFECAPKTAMNPANRCSVW
jgi:predicted metalloendopeptidase